MICGILINLINFAFLSLAVFGHFDTFPDGQLGGEKIKNKDQNSAYLKLKLRLSLAKALHKGPDLF